MILSKKKQADRKFFFLNGIRTAVLFVLFLISLFLFYLVDTVFSFWPIFAASFGAIILSTLNFFLYPRLNFRLMFYYLALTDIVFVSVLVYYSGGITSPFYFLYILPIVYTSVFLARKDTIAVATFSYIVFSVLSDMIYLEVISYYPIVPSIDMTLNIFIYNLIMSFIAFAGVAVLSSYYFERMRKTGAELKHARENLKDLMVLNNTVLGRMDNGFIICDTNGVIISYNERSGILLKLTPRSNIFDLLMPGRPAGDGEPPLDKSYFEFDVNHRVLGISHSIIENIYSYDRVYVFIVTDLTDKRAIEKKLKQKEHFALIGEMSAGIAHEIRNPLASISGSVQFLSKELKLDNESQHLMDIIVKESARLSNSIEVFLEYAKTTPLNRTAFDLAVVIDDVLELVSHNHPDLHVIKRYSTGHTIEADMKKINQVVWNLINNAVKAVAGGGAIEITIYRRDGAVCLSIRDDGVGIDDGDLDRIFTPFYSRFTSGIGLGMPMVKRIIDEHNFRLTIESEKNIGTEVIICCKNM